MVQSTTQLLSCVHLTPLVAALQSAALSDETVADCKQLVSAFRTSKTENSSRYFPSLREAERWVFVFVGRHVIWCVRR